MDLGLAPRALVQGAPAAVLEALDEESWMSAMAWVTHHATCALWPTWGKPGPPGTVSPTVSKRAPATWACAYIAGISSSRCGSPIRIGSPLSVRSPETTQLLLPPPRRVRFHQRHQRLDRGREIGERRHPTLAVGARRAKRSPGSASGPAHSATRPKARRRVRSIWNSRSRTCAQPSPSHAAASLLARICGMPADSRQILKAGARGPASSEAPCFPGRPGIRQRTGMRTGPAELARAPRAPSPIRVD